MSYPLSVIRLGNTYFKFWRNSDGECQICISKEWHALGGEPRAVSKSKVFASEQALADALEEFLADEKLGVA